MAEGSVTIIVKAPNQQFADQTIECEVSWTIKRLKNYLSEVYPNQPKSDEQKLIYSGQLLNDATVLKDILRTYEGQVTHTVHLVCTPKHTSISAKSTQASNNTEAAQPAGLPADNIADGLRQRIPSNSNTATTYLANAGQPVNMTYEMQQQMFLAQQYAMHSTMQQVYLQYLNQYMNSLSANPNSPSTIPATGSHTTTNHTGDDFASTTVVPYMQQYYPHLNNQQLQMVASPQFQQQWLQQRQQLLQAHMGQARPLHTGEAPPAAAAPDDAAAGAPGDAAAQRFPNVVQDEVENHDWLDLFYATSRLLVMVTLVYFYSSLLRCLIVIFFIVLYYLYHIGCFRPLQANVAEANNNHLQAPANDAVAQDGPAAAQAIADDNGENANADAAQNAAATNDGIAAPDQTLSNEVVGQDTTNNRTPVIALVRTFVLSFFASLIPDTPAL